MACQGCKQEITPEQPRWELIPAGSGGELPSVTAHVACAQVMIDSGDWEVL